MAHNSVESMRDRAFLKGRTAFRSDAEYNAALRGEIDDLDEAMEEQQDGIERFATPTEAGEAFRDVLNATPNLDEDDLDCIAATLRNFRNGLSREPLVFAGHFTLKAALDNSREVVVVDVHGEFVVEIQDALGVISEIAEAMECAEPSGTEEIAKKIAETAVSDGRIEDPVLAKLSEALVEDDLEEAFDFIKDSDFDDVELNCGKFLRWRKVIVVDDPVEQTWSLHDANDVLKAVVKADKRMRCGKLANALAELDSYGEEYSVKVLNVAKDIERGVYADGQMFDITDEDGDWLAGVTVRRDGRVVVSVDTFNGDVEVSKEDFVKVTKKFFGDLSNSSEPKPAEERPPTAQEVVLRREMERVKLLTTGKQVLDFARGIAVRPYADYEFKDAIGCVQMKVTLAPPRSGVLSGKPRVYVFGREAAGGSTLVSMEDFSRIAEQVLGE